jgi:hypothetical protein
MLINHVRGLKWCCFCYRSGPPQHSESWVKQVDWIRGSVFDPDTWRHTLSDVQGVISCVGGFGSYEKMKKVCGEANIVAVKTAAEEGKLHRLQIKMLFKLSGIQSLGSCSPDWNSYLGTGLYRAISFFNISKCRLLETKL